MLILSYFACIPPEIESKHEHVPSIENCCAGFSLFFFRSHYFSLLLMFSVCYTSLFHSLVLLLVEINRKSNFRCMYEHIVRFCHAKTVTIGIRFEHHKHPIPVGSRHRIKSRPSNSRKSWRWQQPV